MEISEFAIWKFRTVEGKLKNCRGYDFNTTRFSPNESTSTECYQLKYDFTKEIAILEQYNLTSDIASKIETVPFSEVPKLLKKYKLYEIAPMNERHACSLSEDEKLVK